MSNSPMQSPSFAGVVARAHYGDQQIARIVSTGATTVGISLKAAAGTLEELALFNTSASAIYVKFYDKATAPVVGTDTPVFTLQVPANGSLPIPAGIGKPFVNGIGYGITGAAADTDATAVAAGNLTGYALWS